MLKNIASLMSYSDKGLLAIRIAGALMAVFGLVGVCEIVPCDQPIMPM